MSDRQEAIRSLASVEAEIAASFPRFFDLLKMSPVSLAELQGTGGDGPALLRGDEALVLLTPGSTGMPECHQNGLVFVVTREKVAWAEIPLGPEALTDEIAALRELLGGTGSTRGIDSGGEGGLDDDIRGYDRQKAYQLYQTLFGGETIASVLAEKETWLIAPQGSLVSLPFAALVSQVPPGGASGDADPTYLRQTSWLGLQHTLAMVPSVSSLRVERRYGLDAAGGRRMPSSVWGTQSLKDLREIVPLLGRLAVSSGM